MYGYLLLLQGWRPLELEPFWFPEGSCTPGTRGITPHFVAWAYNTDISKDWGAIPCFHEGMPPSYVRSCLWVHADNVRMLPPYIWEKRYKPAYEWPAWLHDTACVRDWGDQGGTPTVLWSRLSWIAIWKVILWVCGVCRKVAGVPSLLSQFLCPGKLGKWLVLLICVVPGECLALCRFQTRLFGSVDIVQSLGLLLW